MFDKVMDNCCGCMKCKEICPVNAIKKEICDEGFIYPVIDTEICIGCNQCKTGCQFNHERNKTEKSELSRYALKLKDLKRRDASTSGGAFSAFSDFILKKGGTVYGAVLAEDFQVRYERADNFSDRDRMMGAKYTQADATKLYDRIKRDLDDDKYVLVTGTPCVIDAVRGYFKKFKNIDKLYLIDIVCHGVVSPTIFQETIKFIERKAGTQIADYKFRSKINGWHTYTEEAYGANGKVFYNERFMRAFRGLYGSQCAIRESCHSCPYANLNRVGDLTIGDCWGIENADAAFDDNKGVSLVLVNSQKGMQMFDQTKNSFEHISIAPDSCNQLQLCEPSRKSKHREQFWKDYRSHKFNYIVRKYSRYGIINDLKHMIFPYYKKIINIVKK